MIATAMVRRLVRVNKVLTSAFSEKTAHQMSDEGMAQKGE